MNWKQRLEAAQKRGRFTGVDVALSMSFSTCAVGEKMGSERAIRLAWGDPLELLAIKFANAVSENEIAEAKKIYGRIQKA